MEVHDTRRSFNFMMADDLWGDDDVDFSAELLTKIDQMVQQHQRTGPVRHLIPFVSKR